MSIAFITGITGQDGYYLSKLLLEKGYEVHGTVRRSSSINTSRIDDLISEYSTSGQLKLHYSDLLDSASLNNLIGNIKPDEVYNLAAQSHVSVSFEVPEYTANADAIGALRILEAIKFHGYEEITKFYQAGTSEMFGKVREVPQTEKTPFYPRSPYGVAKVYAHWITINYREAYNIFACNGILFNHESPVRGETFVTRKITRALARIKLGLQKRLYIGNLNALRDWGHAKDFVEAQWLMLQQKKPEDFVIATGIQSSVRDFINLASKHLDIKIDWSGKDLNEVGSINGEDIIKVDPKYFRPTEVENLLGDPSKAKEKLNWYPKVSLEQLVKEMIDEDFKLAKNNQIINH